MTDWWALDDELQEVELGKAPPYRGKVNDRKKRNAGKRKHSLRRDRNAERDAKQGLHADVQTSEGNDERMPSQSSRRRG